MPFLMLGEAPVFASRTLVGPECESDPAAAAEAIAATESWGAVA